MSTKKDRVSAFTNNDDEGVEVTFDDAPSARVHSGSVKDAKTALDIAGENASISEWSVAKLIATTTEAETGEPYFDKEHFDTLCECRGDAKRRLEKLLEAMDKADKGN